MRVLFCNSLKADYIQDQLFAGLTELLGSDSVLSFPVNPNYYIPLKSYPRNMGNSRSFASLLKDKWHTRKGIVEFEPNLVVIASTKRDTMESFLRIEPHLPVGIPLVFIDGGDWPEVGGDAWRMNFSTLYNEVIRRRRPDLVFKREYLKGKEYPENVVPLPMAFKPQRNFFSIEKHYQVTLWCVESDPIRTQALQMLQGRYDCTENGSVPGQQFRSYLRKGMNYLKELSASRIACNFRGVGWDTMRYWEIPGVGAFMVSQHPNIVIPDNFIDGKHLVYCHDDLSNLITLLDYYLKNEKEREEMASAAHSHLMKFHTYRHRAEFLLNTVIEKKLIRP